MGKRVLFFQWMAYMQDGVAVAMRRLGMDFEVFLYDLKKEHWDRDEVFQEQLAKRLTEGHFDTLFSLNFAPVASDVCKRLNVHYISWVYDAPVHFTRTETVKRDCNDIYFFDRAQYESFVKLGAKGVHHLPLAADTELFSDEGIKATLEKRRAGLMPGPVTLDRPDEWFDCDVSLVGRLYKSQYACVYFPLDEYYRGYMEGIVHAQQNIKGGYILDDMFSDEMVEKLNEYYVKCEVNGEKVVKEKIVFAVGTEITGRERYTILALLQNRCKVFLYSTDKDERLNNVTHKGCVDYDTEMPRVFRRSKINLNISLSVIQTGIPLRVLDVLASGGFLLTNYQDEIAENFQSGRDLVIYEDYVDLVQKVQYYLAHDDERREIARNGFNRVKELFNFEDRLRVMFCL